jgi:hypothetical protein
VVYYTILGKDELRKAVKEARSDVCVALTVNREQIQLTLANKQVVLKTRDDFPPESDFTAPALLNGGTIIAFGRAQVVLERK